jgi:glycogen operon protein
MVRAARGRHRGDPRRESGFAKSVAVYLNGQGILDLDERGHRVTDDSFLLCFNSHYESIGFVLAVKELGARWDR